MSSKAIPVFAACAFLCASAAEKRPSLSPVSPAGGPLVRLPYNREGTSFLKVGLWAWPMPMDFNRDGILDVVVSNPDLPNAGVFVFEGTNEGVFRPGYRIARPGMWNVLCSMVDGEPVAISAEGTWWNVREDAFERIDRNFVPNPDFDKTVQLPAWHGKSVIRNTTWRYADIDGDGRADRLLAAHTGMMWYRNLGGRGTETRFAPGQRLLGTNGKPIPFMAFANYADFDGDGDLDIVCNFRTDGLGYCENNGSPTRPRFFARSEVKTVDGTPFRMDLCMHTPTAIDWDGDGRPDLIVGDEDGRVAFVRNTGKLDASRTPIFAPPAYLRQRNLYLNYGCLNTPSAVDWDGDGDIDFITGDSAGHVAFVENLSGPGVEFPSWAEPVALSCAGTGGIPAAASTNSPIRIMAGKTGSIQGPGEEKWGYTAVSACDWDGDGLPDVLVGSIWGDVYWHRNIGTRRKPELGPATPIEVAWNGPPPELAWGENKPKGNELMIQWRTTPLGYDWDGDGLADLVTLDVEGFLCLYRRAKRDGKRVLLPPARVFLDEATRQPIRSNAGAAGRSGRRKMCVCDWDGDGKLDIFVDPGGWAGGNAEWWRQIAVADGMWLFRHEGRISPTRLEGHASAPTPVDFNADGVPDLVLGAEDGYFYYLRNPRSK